MRRHLGGTVGSRRTGHRRTVGEEQAEEQRRSTGVGHDHGVFLERLSDGSDLSDLSDPSDWSDFALFQIGTTRFISSIRYWPAAKASPRCGATTSSQSDG